MSVRDENQATATGPDTVFSTVVPDTMDALISGTFNYKLSDGSALGSINPFLRLLGFSWNIQGSTQNKREITVIAKILCYSTKYR